MDGETRQIPAVTAHREQPRIGFPGDLLDRALSVPRACPSTGAVCLRLGEEDTHSPGPLARRLVALLAKDIPVTLDLSSTTAGSLGSRRMADIPEALAPLSELMALREASLHDVAFCLRCDHADIESFSSTENWFAAFRRIVRICDEFMYAMLCDLQVTLSGGAHHPAGTQSARRLWSHWIELQGQSQGPALYLGDPPPPLADRSVSAHGGVVAPLVISAPFSGAQAVFELNLSVFDKPTLWQPNGFCEHLVRRLDQKISRMEWPDPGLALDASCRRLVVVCLTGLPTLANKLGGKPSLVCDRMRRLFDGLRRGLLVASRRRYLEKKTVVSQPDWVADIRCPVTRGDVRRKLSVDHLRPNISLAASPWDLVRAPGQRQLLPLIADLDCLVWRLPGPEFAGFSSLDRLQREVWAARSKSRR